MPRVHLSTAPDQVTLLNPVRSKRLHMKEKRIIAPTHQDQCVEEKRKPCAVSLSSQENMILNAGDRIRFYNPTKVCSADNIEEATILEVFGDKDRNEIMAPIRLNCNIPLMLMHSIRVVSPYEMKEFIPLSSFRFVAGILSDEDMKKVIFSTESTADVAAEKSLIEAAKGIKELVQSNKISWENEKEILLKQNDDDEEDDDKVEREIEERLRLIHESALRNSISESKKRQLKTTSIYEFQPSNISSSKEKKNVNYALDDAEEFIIERNYNRESNNTFNNKRICLDNSIQQFKNILDDIDDSSNEDASSGDSDFVVQTSHPVVVKKSTVKQVSHKKRKLATTQVNRKRKVVELDAKPLVVPEPETIRFKPHYRVLFSPYCSFEARLPYYNFPRPRNGLVSTHWVEAWESQAMAAAIVVRPLVATDFVMEGINYEKKPSINVEWPLFEDVTISLNSLIQHYNVQEEPCHVYLLKRISLWKDSDEIVKLSCEMKQSFFQTEEFSYYATLHGSDIEASYIQENRDILLDIFPLELINEEIEYHNDLLKWNEKEQVKETMKLLVSDSKVIDTYDILLSILSNTNDSTSHHSLFLNGLIDNNNNIIEHSLCHYIQPIPVEMPSIDFSRFLRLSDQSLIASSSSALDISENIVVEDDNIEYEWLELFELPLIHDTRKENNIDIIQESLSENDKFTELFDPCGIVCATDVVDVADSLCVASWQQFSFEVPELIVSLPKIDSNIQLGHLFIEDVHAISSQLLPLHNNNNQMNTHNNNDIIVSFDELELDELMLPLISNHNINNIDDVCNQHYVLNMLDVSCFRLPAIEEVQLCMIISESKQCKIHSNIFQQQAFMDERIPKEKILPDIEYLSIHSSEYELYNICKITDSMEVDKEQMITLTSLPIQCKVWFTGLHYDNQESIFKRMEHFTCLATQVPIEENILSEMDDKLEIYTNPPLPNLTIQTAIMLKSDQSDALDQYIRLHKDGKVHATASVRLIKGNYDDNVEFSTTLVDFSCWLHAQMASVEAFYWADQDESKRVSPFDTTSQIVTQESLLCHEAIDSNQPYEIRAKKIKLYASIVIYICSLVLQNMVHAGIYSAYYCFHSTMNNNAFKTIITASSSPNFKSFSSPLNDLGLLLKRMMNMDANQTIQHPKWTHLCNIIADSTLKQPYGRIILILVQRHCVLIELLIKLRSFGKVAVIDNSISMNKLSQIDALQGYDIAIGLQSIVYNGSKEFPWSNISKLILYDCSLDPPIGITNDIWAYTSLIPQVKVLSIILPNNMDDALSSDLPYAFEYNVMIMVSDRFISTFEESCKLAQERNVSMLTRELSFEDVVLDEKSCCVFFPVAHVLGLENSDQMKQISSDFVVQLALLASSYSTCFVLLLVDNVNLLNDTNWKNILLTLQNAVYLEPSLNVYLEYVKDGHMCLNALFRCINHVSSTNETWQCNLQAWCERNWLQVNATPSENFLASFPQLNHFSAQMILYGAGISAKDFILLSQEEINEQCGWLGESICEEIYVLMNADFGIDALRVMIESHHNDNPIEDEEEIIRHPHIYQQQVSIKEINANDHQEQPQYHQEQHYEQQNQYGEQPYYQQQQYNSPDEQQQNDRFTPQPVYQHHSPVHEEMNYVKETPIQKIDHEAWFAQFQANKSSETPAKDSYKSRNNNTFDSTPPRDLLTFRTPKLRRTSLDVAAAIDEAKGIIAQGLITSHTRTMGDDPLQAFMGKNKMKANSNTRRISRSKGGFRSSFMDAII